MAQEMLAPAQTHLKPLERFKGILNLRGARNAIGRQGNLDGQRPGSLTSGAGMPVRPHELSERIRSATQSCIAFDIFDTLVERTVTPEHVKMLACDRLSRLLGAQGIDGDRLYQLRRSLERDLCERNFAQHQELEFRFSELSSAVYEKLSAVDVAPCGLTEAKLHAMMLDCELASERLVLRPIRPAIEALGLARQLGKTVVLVSDFYLARTAIERMIEPFTTLANIEALFVSSDWMASKRSGRLYDIICRELRVAAADLLMIGDNAHSDYLQARTRGIQAILVQEPERSAFYQSAAASVVDRALRESAMRDVLAHSNLTADRNLRAIVPSLHLFIERLYVTARREGLRHLCFLAREGASLRTMFDIYQEALSLPESERIQTHYLLVSRRSCYAPSLKPLHMEHFEGLFRYYNRMSLRDFLRSLGFTPVQIASLQSHASVDFDLIIDQFSTSSPYERLRNSRPFAQLYEQHRTEQNANLRAYLSELGIPYSDHPLALVDVGWKGSIQDYLHAALPDVRICGYYIGLLNAGQPLQDKTGLVFGNVPRANEFYGTYTENRTLFELLLCAEHGSVLRYEKNIEGCVSAILDDNESEMDYIRREVMPLRNDMLAGFSAFCEVRNRYCASDDEQAAFAADTYANFVFRPWRPAAKSVAAAQHQESFGVFVTSKYLSDDRLTLRDKYRFWYRLARNPRETLRSSFWPALTLLQYTNKSMTRLYGAYRRAQDHRRRQIIARDRAWS